MAAFGRFDSETEKLFLGIEQDRYTGGRLENYTDVDTDLTEKIIKTLERFSDIAADHPKADPYEFVIILEEEKDAIWR